MAEATPPMHTGGLSAPDPTTLTTEMLQREIKTLREILEAIISGQKSEFAARLDGNDKAIILLQTMHDKLPAQMETKAAHIKEVFGERFNTVGEKFHGIDTQFALLDAAKKEAALSQTTAVNAALQAQKEAAGEQVKAFEKSIDKSETATTKQIDALFLTLQTATAALDSKIDTAGKGVDGKIEDIKDRLARIESLAVGQATAQTNQRAGAGETRAYVALGISVLVAVIALVGLVVSTGMR